MKCDNCESLATQIRETYSYCNRCHTREFSTIKIDGVERHFLVVLKEQLEKMGLQRKEGETIDQWGKRCREATSLNPKILGGLA